MSGPLVALRGVRHSYDSAPALWIEELDIGRGTTALLGPNGSGKSTLLRLVATVVARQHGSISIGGLDPRVVEQRTEVRRRLGYVDQTDGLPARMRVWEYCDYVGALKEIESARLRRRWTTWALDRVGLSDMADARVKSLSGGMARRLSIAQALMGAPNLLVLDEPLSGLDAEWRARITTLIVSLREQTTVLCSTHHADDLASVCDSVTVLSHGAVAFSGAPTALAERARGRVWEQDHAGDGSAVLCRAVGPGRFRCVSDAIPAGRTAVDPSVTDGYFAAITPRRR